MTLRIALLASGSGRTVENLGRRWREGRLDAEPVVVLSNKRRAGVHEKARSLEIPSVVCAGRRGEDPASYGRRVFERLRPFAPDYVCLAGFLKLLPIPADYRGRVINIHPSLIPAFSGLGFYGARVHQAAFTAGVRVSGCTVHFCDDQYDTGPILLQSAVALEPEDGPEVIAGKVFAAELEAYPEALSLLAAGRVRLSGGRCLIDPLSEA
jgi:phosphoribosylglycinamide formyltransferase 1